MLAEPVVFGGGSRKHCHCNALIILRMTVRHDDAFKELSEGAVCRRHHGIVLDAVAVRDLFRIIAFHKPQIAVPDHSEKLRGQCFLPALCIHFLPLLYVNILHGINGFLRTLVAVKSGQCQNRAHPFCGFIWIARRINTAVFYRNLIIADRHQAAQRIKRQIIAQRGTVIRVHHCDQLFRDLLKRIYCIWGEAACRIRMDGTEDGLACDQINMQHQAENIGDAGQDVVIAQRDSFELLLLQMAVVAVLAEQKKNLITCGRKRKARPAVSCIGHTPDIAEDGFVCILKMTELFLGKSVQKSRAVVRVNDNLSVALDESIIGGEMCLCVHQRIFMADDTDIPLPQVNAHGNEICRIENGLHQIHSFRRRTVCTVVYRKCRGRFSVPFQTDSMNNSTAGGKPRLFLEMKPVNAVICEHAAEQTGKFRFRKER